MSATATPMSTHAQAGRLLDSAGFWTAAAPAAAPAATAAPA
jgi:hypothetical protein